ncbi:hypothetical protein AC1659_30530 [Rhodococcus erythropolis]|uniref:hypothetical protein n=1 Tax=Rhodococcus erythropolis TaxID=1833 RepID=UPI001BA70162|nr:hypothetical protein [Rhodococcus erythropolis]MBS2993620.1 hypothetical protein [Rhodococcus erythropolis]
MPTYDRPVFRSKLVAKALAGEIRQDLDDTVGGISWWANYQLGRDTLSELSHYAVSAAQSVATNLDEAALHYFQYQERIRAEDIFLTRKLTEGRGQLTKLNERQEIDRRREAEIGAHRTAFFRSIGSTLDTLAGVTIVVSALSLNVLRADFGMLCTSDTSDTYPRLTGPAGGKLRKALATDTSDGAHAQETLLRGIRAAVVAAGPPGWVQWTLETRNSFVHRSQWLKMTMHDRPHRTAPTNWIRPLPRTPAQSEGAALRAADTLTDTYLTEDALASMHGVLESVDAVIKAVIEQCSHLWTRRRANPHLLEQPGSQWTAPTTAASFDGYRPGSAQRAFDNADAILVHPTEGKRLLTLIDPQEATPRRTK